MGNAFAEDSVLSQPQPQDGGAVLRYKFTAGELLRYNLKMLMNMSMNISGQAKTFPMTTTGVYRMRTVKVLPNGDAEIRAAAESMKCCMNGQELPIKASQLPVVSAVMSPRGEWRDVKIEGGDAMMNGNPLGGMSGMQSTSPVFPEKGLKVGDSWTQEMPFPGGNGGKISMDGKIKNQFLLTSASAKAASIQQYCTGTFQMKINTGTSAGTVSSNGDIDMKGTQCFSLEKGCLISTNMSGKSNVTTSMPGSNGGNIAMQMQMTITMTLIQ